MLEKLDLEGCTYILLMKHVYGGELSYSVGVVCRVMSMAVISALRSDTQQKFKSI